MERRTRYGAEESTPLVVADPTRPLVVYETLYVDAISADGVPYEGGAEPIPWQVWEDEC
jgi:hypothetical protein